MTRIEPVQKAAYHGLRRIEEGFIFHFFYSLMAILTSREQRSCNDFSRSPTRLNAHKEEYFSMQRYLPRFFFWPFLTEGMEEFRNFVLLGCLLATETLVNGNGHCTFFSIPVLQSWQYHHVWFLASADQSGQRDERKLKDFIDEDHG